MKNICSFLNIPFSKKILNWHEYSSVIKNKAWYGKVQKISANSIQKWKNPENKNRTNEIMKNDEIVRLLKQLNYEV